MAEEIPQAAPAKKDGPGIDAMVALGGDPSSPFTSMVAGVSSALTKMQELLPKEGVPEELVAELGSINDQYQGLLARIQKAGAGGAPKPPAQPGAPGPGMVDANGGPGGIPMR